jgi:hypothetical protein
MLPITRSGRATRASQVGSRVGASPRATRSTTSTRAQNPAEVVDNVRLPAISHQTTTNTAYGSPAAIPPLTHAAIAQAQGRTGNLEEDLQEIIANANANNNPPAEVRVYDGTKPASQVGSNGRFSFESGLRE